LTPQPMTGALLGMLVELSQLEPVFADGDERPEEALNRHVPLLVIIADGDVDAFKSDLFLARAQHRGINVVVFGVSHRGGTPVWAKERGLPYLELPTDAEAFGRILDEGRLIVAALAAAGVLLALQVPRAAEYEREQHKAVMRMILVRTAKAAEIAREKGEQKGKEAANEAMAETIADTMA